MHHLPHDGLIQLIRLAGYPGLFGIVFAETAVFFGFFLPGASLLFTAGLLAAHGYLNLSILVAIFAAAAILGDNLAYWTGRTVGEGYFFKREKSRFFKKMHVDRAKIFFEKYGVLAIILARFIPIVRTFSPVIAGIVGMRFSAFLFYDIAGAIMWSAAFTIAGYEIGDRVPFISTYLTPIIMALVVLSVIPIVLELRKPHKRRSGE